jgi:hypothetical protein
MKRVQRLAAGILIVALVLLALVYAGDYLYVRYRIARHQPGDPFDVVTIQPTYAIAQKDGRVEIVLGDPETQPCVHSLFAHFGLTPCWYLKRNSQKPEMIGGAIIFSPAIRGLVEEGPQALWRPGFAKAVATYSTRRPAPQSIGRSRSSAASEG